MKTSQEQILEAAKGVMPKVLEIRRYLHQHPELRWEEGSPLDYIQNRFPAALQNDASGLAVTNTGGIYLDLTFDPNWDRILFRADVDALPIQEETGLEFASQNPGVMQACGHDMHAAMLLGAVKAIAEGKVKPVHNLRFVFQRAEENPGQDPRPESGGRVLVDEGVCDGISHVYGLHIGADEPAGMFMSRAGGMMANSDRIKVVITCSGGHVKDPHNGSNAIRIGNRIGCALEGFVSTTLKPEESVVLEPTISNAGTASNIRPAKGEFWYGVRNMLPEGARTEFAGALRGCIEHIVSGFEDAACDVEYIRGHPALINDESSFRYVSSLLSEATYSVTEAERSFGGEDFAYYLRRCPGSFWWLGARNPEMPGGHHTATFNPLEGEMEKGVAFWLLLATSPSP